MDPLKAMAVPDKKMPNYLGLILVYFSVAIDLMGASLVEPIIPIYVVKYGGTSLEVGMCFASYALTQMVSMVLTGTLSDTFGRRKLLLISIFGSAAGLLFQGFSRGLVLFIVARAATVTSNKCLPITST